MTGRLQDKVAIVTGAGRGIGRAIATAFAREGARVPVVDVDGGSASECADALRKSGAAAEHLRADVRSAADTRAMASTATDAFGRIDILCPNAAIFDGSAIETMPETLWDRVIGVTGSQCRLPCFS